MMTYVFDLDETICVPNLHKQDTQGRYREAVPISQMIEKMKRLKERGDVIVIHTARRMLTHSGNIQKIIEDVGQVTKDWLKEHGVPYDSLVFGKPYGDKYIDDKACLPEDFQP